MKPGFPRGLVPLLLVATLLPTGASGAARKGLELAVQHATEDTDQAMEPVEFPVSGSLTGTLDWPLGSRLRLRTGVGYEERWTASRLTIQFLGPSSEFDLDFDFETRARSFVLPLRLAGGLGRVLELEAGPEWRWMLQTRTRVSLADPSILGPAGEGTWTDVTSEWERSSFALGAGVSAHWPLKGGEGRVGFRWCEALGNQHAENFLGLSSRFRELQLMFAWSR